MTDDPRVLLAEMSESLANAASALAMAALKATPEQCDTYVRHLVATIEQLADAMKSANDDVSRKEKN